jgi:hypothetical protein
MVTDASRPDTAEPVVAGGGRTLLTLAKPDADGMTSRIVAVGPDKHICTNDWPAYVLYYAGDGTPVNGEIWGTVAGEQQLYKGRPGFVILGDPDGSKVRVMKDVPNTLVELCLIDDHPGRGIAFDTYLGTWNPSTNGWDYDCLEIVKAIDWRYGVPYPGAGARGLFTPRASTTHGTIYENVSLDCQSPGPCCAE